MRTCGRVWIAMKDTDIIGVYANPKELKDDFQRSFGADCKFSIDAGFVTVKDDVYRVLIHEVTG